MDESAIPELLKNNFWYAVGCAATEAQVRASFERKHGFKPDLCFQHKGLWFCGPVGKFNPGLSRFCHPLVSDVAI